MTSLAQHLGGFMRSVDVILVACQDKAAEWTVHEATGRT